MQSFSRRGTNPGNCQPITAYLNLGTYKVLWEKDVSFMVQTYNFQTLKINRQNGEKTFLEQVEYLH